MDKVRLVLIVLLAELDHVSHRFRLPVGEGSVDVWDAWHLWSFEVRVFEDLQLVGVVAHHFMIFLGS